MDTPKRFRKFKVKEVFGANTLKNFPEEDLQNILDDLDLSCIETGSDMVLRFNSGTNRVEFVSMDEYEEEI